MQLKYFFFTLMILGLPCLKAQTSFSLEEAIVYGQQHSKEVALDVANINDADHQVKEYLALGIPKITANVGYQYAFEIPTQILPDFISPSVYGVLFKEELLEERPIDFGNGIPAQFGLPHNLDAGIELQTLIFDGSYFVGLRAQRMYKRLVREQHATVVYNVKYKVTEAYLTVLNLEKNIQLFEDNIQNLQKLHDDTKAIFESGFAEKLDVDRLQLSLRNLHIEQKNLTRLRDVALLALKFNMGYPIKEVITLTDTFDQLSDLAQMEAFDIDGLNYNSRTELQAMETAAGLQELNIKRLKFGYLPALTGFVNYGQTLQRENLFDRNDNGWFPRSMIGLNLSIPIFDGGDKRAKLARARIAKDKVDLQKSLFEESVELEVKSRYLQYINAREKMISMQSNVALAKEIYDVTKIKYTEGVGSSVEVTQAESEWYRAQTHYSAAQYEFITTVYQLKNSLGNL